MGRRSDAIDARHFSRDGDADTMWALNTAMLMIADDIYADIEDDAL